MKEYLVSFEIDISAETPQEACRDAWVLLSGQNADIPLAWYSPLPVGLVTDADGNQTTIDLEKNMQEDIECPPERKDE